MANPGPTKTTDLCDASAAVQVCELPWQSFGGRAAFAGTVCTVRYDDGLGILRTVLREPGQGRVLVIDGGGLPWHAMFGDVMAALAVQQGWEGVVVHGKIRDRAEIDAMPLGVKALGVVPRRASIAGQGERDVPVQMGGVSLVSGMWLVADADGVVVLPAGLGEADLGVEQAVAATAAYASRH